MNAMQCLLTWQAIYKDGTILNQFDKDKENSSEQIDRSKLKEFRLLKDDSIIFVAFFSDDRRKLVFRRRTFLSAANEVKGIVYLVGWHENVKGVSVKSICYIYEDGHIEFDDARNNLELVKCEE
jgi:hypothetical protein